MSRAVRFVPLIVLLLFVAAVAWRLLNPPSETVASKMTGKPLPPFKLEPAIPGKPGLASTDLALGQPRLINIFASWCVPCATEAPILSDLRKAGVPIDAVAVRDRAADVEVFLERHGDPFDRIGADPDSRLQLALGSSGVPETFVVDGQGIIRYQHIGPVEAGDVPTLMNELARAE